MKRIYTIDWSIFVRENLPIALRRTLLVHTLISAVSGVRQLHNRFLDCASDWLYKQRHTAQVVHIEKVLNDAFDDVARRIYVQNVQFQSYKYLYPDGEDPHFLQEDGAVPDAPMYLLEDGAGTISPDATIYVPMPLRPSAAIEIENFENAIRGLVDYYKTWGVNYQILYYE